LGWLNRDLPLGQQLLARTTPNFLNLMIALTGGAAGAYAAASPKVSSAAVGVAIATALCPPLTTCGILMAHGHPQLAAGALLLFTTNLTAIAFAAMVTFLIMGHRATWTVGVRSSMRMVPLATLLVLGVYLFGVFRQTVEHASLRKGVESALQLGLGEVPGTWLVEVRLTTEQGRRVAFAVVRTPKPLPRDIVARLDDAIDKAVGRDVSLHVRSVLVEEMTREGPALIKSTGQAPLGQLFGGAR
jgi:uncharacterized membrane protein